MQEKVRANDAMEPGGGASGNDGGGGEEDNVHGLDGAASGKGGEGDGDDSSAAAVPTQSRKLSRSKKESRCVLFHR